MPASLIDPASLLLPPTFSVPIDVPDAGVDPSHGAT